MKQRIHILVLICVMIAIAEASGVSATIFNETTGVNLVSASAQTGKMGVKFTVYGNCTNCQLTGVYKNQSLNDTIAYIYNVTSGGVPDTMLANASIVSSKATFSYPLTAGATYCIMTDNNNLSRNHVSNAGPAYPINKNTGYYNRSCYIIGTPGTDTAIYNIVAISVDNSASFSLSVNDTRTGSLISGFRWSYTSSNSSDPNPKNGFCSTTICSLTNYTGLLNVTLSNISAGNYENTSIVNFNYTNSNSSTTAQTYASYIIVGQAQPLNSTGASGVSATIRVSNGTTSQEVFHTGNPATVSIYHVFGNISILYYNMTDSQGSHDYFNISVDYTGNNSLTNYNATTFAISTGDSRLRVYQVLLNLSAFRLFTGASIATFNVTNNNSFLSDLKFNSTSNTFALLRAMIGSSRVQFDIPGNYSKNVTCTAVQSFQTVNCNATDIYDDLYTIGASFNGVSVTNFTVSASNNTLGGTLYNTSTTNGSVTFPLIQGYNYFFYIMATGYAYANATLAANASTNLYNFSLLRANVINFTFYDEQTNVIITTANITLDIIGSSGTGQQFTTTNGTISTTVLTPDEYTLRYYGINNTGGSNYTTRFWYMTLSNNTAPILRLPMLKASGATAVTGSVITSTGVPLSDETVKAYKYDPFSGSYVLNQIVISGTQGEFTMNLQFANELYYFTVEDSTGVLYTSVPAYIYSTTLEPFVINIAVGGFTDLFDSDNIVSSLTFNNVTSTATFTYTDLDSIATQGCLYTYNFTTTGKVLYATTCISSAGGSIQSVIVPNGTWEFQAIVTKSGVDQLQGDLIQQYPSVNSSESSGKMGLFILFMIIMVFVFVLREHLPIMVVVVGCLPLLFSIVGWVAIGVPYTLPIAILSVGVALLLGNNQPSLG